MSDHPAAVVERALVAIRRGQSRRALAQLAEARTRSDTSHADVLDIVEERDASGMHCSVGAVAERLGVDQPRASRLVAQSVDAGLLERAADQSDGRRSLLVLTSAGQAYLDQVHGFRRSMVVRAMAGWPPGDRATFARLLRQFVQRFDELTARDSSEAGRPG